MPPPQESPGAFGKPSAVINPVLYVAYAITACFTPALHTGMGTHAFYQAGIPAVVFMFMFAGFDNCPLVAWYIPAWLVLVGYRRATADRTQHSQYQGYPWPLRFLPEKRARMLEPVLLFAAGVWLSQYSAGLADFFLFGAVAMYVVLASELIAVEAMQRRHRDAKADMERQSRWSRGNW